MSVFSGVIDLVAGAEYQVELGFQPDRVEFIDPITGAALSNLTWSKNAGGDVRIPVGNAGIKQVQKLVFDADLITANVIDGKVAGVAITQVAFDTDNLTTLGALATEIAGKAGIETAVVEGTDSIVVTTEIDVFDRDLTEFAVTLGATQAGVTEVAVVGSLKSNSRILTHQPAARIATAEFGSGDVTLADPSIDAADYVDYKEAIDYMRNAGGATLFKDAFYVGRGFDVKAADAFSDGKVEFLASKYE